MILLDTDAKIFLVGFMGSGKTTLGRLLAARLGWDFVDLDERMEVEEGSSILHIFAEKGEPYFRELESRVLRELASRRGNAVIACGGGTFCSAENKTMMRQRGITVWLDQPFDQIWARREDLARRRPLLRGEGEVRALYEDRIRFYRDAAFHLPVSEGGLERTLEALVHMLQERTGLGQDRDP
jgi:shikimate kinase